ncbi:hypothetical protein DFH09DRAFT_1187686, partial [Mycena vulgaris]
MPPRRRRLFESAQLMVIVASIFCRLALIKHEARRTYWAEQEGPGRAWCVSAFISLSSSAQIACSNQARAIRISPGWGGRLGRAWCASAPIGALEYILVRRRGLFESGPSQAGRLGSVWCVSA